MPAAGLREILVDFDGNPQQSQELRRSRLRFDRPHRTAALGTANTAEDGLKLAKAIPGSCHPNGRLESLVFQHLVERVNDLGEVALVRHHLVDVLVRVRVLVE